MLLRRIQKFQRGFCIASGHQFGYGLELMAQIMALDLDIFFHFLYSLQFFF